MDTRRTTTRAVGLVPFVVLGLSLTGALALGIGIRQGGFREASDFLTVLMGILLEAFPFVLLGTLLSSLINTLVTPNLLARIIPKNRLFGLFIASLSGFAFPICECANVPVTRRLIAKGLPTPIAVSFLLSVAIVNPVVLLSTWMAFGGSWTAVLARGGLGMGIAMLVGWIVGLAPSLRNPLKDDAVVSSSAHDCACSHGHEGEASFQHEHEHEHEHEHAHEPEHECHCSREPAARRSSADLIKEVLVHASSELYDVGRFLIMGATVAALMQVAIPRASLIGIGLHPILSVAVLMLLAYVLSLCSEADAFIAATFAGYFTPGAVVAFMVYGPMMDVKNTLMLLGGFKPRFVLALLALTTLLCLASGIVINYGDLIGAFS